MFIHKIIGRKRVLFWNCLLVSFVVLKQWVWKHETSQDTYSGDLKLGLSSSRILIRIKTLNLTYQIRFLCHFHQTRSLFRLWELVSDCFAIDVADQNWILALQFNNKNLNWLFRWIHFLSGCISDKVLTKRTLCARFF